MRSSLAPALPITSSPTSPEIDAPTTASSQLQSDVQAYALPPEGRLFLAYVDDKVAGCIAMRKLEESICEIKRLFVRDGFRGQKVGVHLIEKLIEEAQKENYSKMRLDTFPPKMGKAVSLYEAHGFRAIPCYYDNPYEGVLFMECDL